MAIITPPPGHCTLKNGHPVVLDDDRPPPQPNSIRLPAGNTSSSGVQSVGQQGLPIMAVGALVPTPLNSMIAKNGSKLQTLKNIKGATVGSAGLPFDGAVVQTIAQREHLASGDIKSVNVGFNLVPALLTGKADAIIGGYWNIEAVQVKNQTGKKPVVFKMGQLGVPSYDELIIVAPAASYPRNRTPGDTRPSPCHRPVR